MKLFVMIAATLIAFSAKANDTKIGNVIAVDRQVSNIYEACVQNIVGDTTKEQSFFTCAFSVLKSPTEVAVSKGGVIRFKDDRCDVNADTANGSVMVVFGRAKGNTDINTAKVCLQRALQTQNSVSVLVYTIQ